ncbi:MAG: sugar-transfer associated ATP-grasp domain-containing protein [Actinomycetota bacterium]
MFEKIERKIIKCILMKMGYSAYMSAELAKEIKEDLIETKVSVHKRMWAYNHGFLARRIHDYGLNESNYKDYENDFHYLKLHPINDYSKWIDDKLTTRYMLYPFSEYLPKYYYELRNGNVHKLIDCPEELSADISSVIDLLNLKTNIALKQVSGTGGIGFYKLSKQEDRYLINNQMMNKDEIRIFIAGLNKYIVTEYLISHEYIRKIYSISPNTLRIIVAHNENENPIIIGSFFRFGTKSTGVVDNVDAGGMLCGVDIETGQFYNPKYRNKDSWIQTNVHVDTKVKIEGIVPHWNLITKKIIEICNYLPQLKYLGFDIIVTDGGFKIIEINSHIGICTTQMYYPMLKNSHLRRLFNKDNEK